MGLRGKLARDTAVLTAAAVVMRCVGMVWQVWLAGRIGAAGLGLWQLVASVNVFAATVAISGARFTATRLVSEELGAGRIRGAARAVRRCLVYGGLCGLFAFAALYWGAERIGFVWMRDARCVRALRLLACSLPMVPLSCVLNGSFVARGRARLSALTQLAEQLASIAGIVFLLSRVGPNDLEGACAAIAGGGVFANAVGLLLSVVLYLRLRRRDRGADAGVSPPLTKRMLRLAAPLALSAYARTGLSTLENLLTPRKLRASGLSAERALAGYGTVTGMALPVIGFPSCVLSAVAELSVPMLTAAQVRGDGAEIRRTVRRLLSYALGYALLCALFLFCLAEPLGWVVYRTAEVGPYLRLLALLVPFFYCDIVIDGCLKGLGQMLWSMCFNVAESALGVVLIVTLLPRWGLRGYLTVLFVCEIFNVSLSFWRLRRVVRTVKSD